MAATIKLGNKEWAAKKDSLLAYNDEDNNFKPLPFDFTRASSATYVGSDGLIKTSTTAQPRIDFADNTDGHLLLEPARTNLITYSEDFSQSYWAKFAPNLTIVPNAITSPIGTNNASKLVSGSTDAQQAIYKSITQSNCTFSVYAKKAEFDTVSLKLSGSQQANFDLTNGTVGYNTNVIPAIENVGNGWYRCSITITSGSSAYAWIAISSGNTQGDQTSGIYIWGAQLEAGAYPTSYIPTNGGSVTRAAETCVNSGNNQVINSTEGVLFVEMAALADDGTDRQICLRDNTWTNRIFLRLDATSNQITFRYYIGGSLTINLLHTLTDTTIFNKIACKWELNKFKLYVNGNKVAEDLSANVMGADLMNRISFDDGLGTNVFFGEVKQLKVYNTALKDSELKTLTT